MTRPVITFLSDYGLQDDFVGVCHGVMARVAPDARVIDVSHGVPRHDVRAGALILRRALPSMPPGVHLAVVDPAVGTARRAIAVRTAEEDRLLVGPDNGLLSLAADYVLFASGSAAKAFHAAAGTLAGPRLVSIGPTTSGVLRELGAEPHVEAAEPTPAALVAAVVADVRAGVT